MNAQKREAEARKKEDERRRKELEEMSARLEEKEKAMSERERALASCVPPSSPDNISALSSELQSVRQELEVLTDLFALACHSNFLF